MSISTAAPDATENPFESVKTAIACSTRDWALHYRDAWIYGVIIGWDDASLKEIARQHGWKRSEVNRLRRLHESFEACSIAYGLKQGLGR